MAKLKLISSFGCSVLTKLHITNPFAFFGAESVGFMLIPNMVIYSHCILPLYYSVYYTLLHCAELCQNIWGMLEGRSSSTNQITRFLNSVSWSTIYSNWISFSSTLPPSRQIYKYLHTCMQRQICHSMDVTPLPIHFHSFVGIVLRESNP